MKYILLNWLTPGLVEIPSPAMSVLKSYLTSYGYTVKVEYWNMKMMKLEDDFIWHYIGENGRTEDLATLIYCNYLAFKYDDHEAKNKVKSVLIRIRPSILSVDPYYIDRHMATYYHKLDIAIDEEIENINWDEILYAGFPAKLYQWIPASILCDKIKEFSPNTIIILGGIGTKDAAIDYLTNFPQFDFATWGEGETIMKQFSDTLSGKSEKSHIYKIPNIAFRCENGIHTSVFPLHDFSDLNDANTEPTFTDYFIQKEKYNINQVSYLFIEGSRGCHWRKCHFCYLNTGYKNRIKNAKNIALYIEKCIKEYHVSNFTFLDNDVVANDFKRFNLLLDYLLDIKSSHPDFSIIMAEIITKDFTENLIRKMSLAGFQRVQIGYESPSDRLLKKIDKKNTFASNLLFIKFAFKYNIKIGGMNVITGLIEETYSDVVEAIENIRFMRFFLRRYKHNMSRLAIMKSSRYYDATKEDGAFTLSNIYDKLPSTMITKKAMYDCNIVEKVRLGAKSVWDDFTKVENYYRENEFCYNIYDIGASVLYQEYLNGEKINEIEIEKNSLEYHILVQANSKILSDTELFEMIKQSEMYKNMLDCEVFNVLEELRNEGLLYISSNNSELLTIIDIKENH